MKSNFVQRTITGVLFVVVLVGGILLSPISFGVLFALITVLAVREFGHFTDVASDAWYAVPVEKAYKNAYVNGIAGTKRTARPTPREKKGDQ